MKLQGIQTGLNCWIRMRIHIRKADPDPGIQIALYYGTVFKEKNCFQFRFFKQFKCRIFVIGTYDTDISRELFYRPPKKVLIS